MSYYSNSEKRDPFQIITDQIIDMLNKGTIPWHKPWTSVNDFPTNLSTGKQYRGINIFVLYMTSMAKGYNSRYWLTFNQAKKLGGSIKKGEKSTTIINCSFKKITDTDENGEEEEKTIPIIKTWPVFNTDQCEGIDVPVENLATNNDITPINICEQIVINFKNPPVISHSGNRACYVPSIDTIRIPNRSQFHSPEYYHQTLFHELIHSTGSSKRLSRTGITDEIMFGSHQYSREELIAEMGAAFLCAHTGISVSTIQNSAAYISNWLEKLRNDKRLVIQAAGQAQKAVDYILGKKYDETQEDAS
jgi:antirestriction protein ArdC